MKMIAFFILATSLSAPCFAQFTGEPEIHYIGKNGKCILKHEHNEYGNLRSNEPENDKQPKVEPSIVEKETNNLRAVYYVRDENGNFVPYKNADRESDKIPEFDETTLYRPISWKTLHER